MPQVVVSHSRSVCLAPSLYLVYIASAFPHRMMQNPAKVGGGGVAAPKPPHSLNSSSVLPPEPPVLVSESHSGHCTDFLKVDTFFLYICAASVTFGFHPGYGHQSQQTAAAARWISGARSCYRRERHPAFTFRLSSPGFLPVSLCTLPTIPTAASACRPLSPQTADRQCPAAAAAPQSSFLCATASHTPLSLQARVSHDPIMNENAGRGPLPYSTTTHSHIVSPLTHALPVSEPDHKVAGVNRSRYFCYCYALPLIPHPQPLGQAGVNSAHLSRIFRSALPLPASLLHVSSMLLQTAAGGVPVSLALPLILFAAAWM